MSLQKDINPKGQRFVHHCLPFSLSLFLSLYLSLSLSLSSSFCLFPHPWNLATQPEGSQVHSEASHVGFSLQPWCRSQQTASVNQYVCKRDKAEVIPAPRLRSSSWDPRHCRAQKIPHRNPWPIESRSVTNGSFILLSFRVIYYVSIVTRISS